MIHLFKKRVFKCLDCQRVLTLAKGQWTRLEYPAKAKVYHVMCDCGTLYEGDIKDMVETLAKEKRLDVRLEYCGLDD